MLTKIDAVLQEAILELPQKEKDKLLLRLIRKNKTLINQLHFQLLEDESDLLARRNDTLAALDDALALMEVRLEARRYYTAKDLLKTFRALSGVINQHVLITKDKVGEIELRAHILSETFRLAPGYFQESAFGNEKLLHYAAGRIKNLLTSFEKLHEDLRYDYQEAVDQIVDFAEMSGFVDRAG